MSTLREELEETGDTVILQRLKMFTPCFLKSALSQESPGKSKANGNHCTGAQQHRMN